MERDFVELVRHVYFHAFHAKIKNIGEHIIKVRDQQCLLDRMSRNMIPELPDRLQCAWSDCQVLEYLGICLNIYMLSNFVEA